jgi:hypothetical protein
MLVEERVHMFESAIEKGVKELIGIEQPD